MESFIINLILLAGLLILPIAALILSRRSFARKRDAFAALSLAEITRISPPSTIPIERRELYRLIPTVKGFSLTGDILDSKGERIARISDSLGGAMRIEGNDGRSVSCKKLPGWLHTTKIFSASAAPDTSYTRGPGNARIREMKVGSEIAKLESLATSGDGFRVTLNGREVAIVFRPAPQYNDLISLFDNSLPITVSWTLPVLHIFNANTFVRVFV